MKHILSVNPIAFINEDLKQGDHFMHSIFEKVCEVGAKSIVLMEEFYDVQPHLNLYKANELKKQITGTIPMTAGCSIRACAFRYSAWSAWTW